MHDWPLCVSCLFQTVKVQPCLSMLFALKFSQWIWGIFNFKSSHPAEGQNDSRLDLWDPGFVVNPSKYVRGMRFKSTCFWCEGILFLGRSSNQSFGNFINSLLAWSIWVLSDCIPAGVCLAIWTSPLISLAVACTWISMEVMIFMTPDNSMFLGKRLRQRSFIDRVFCLRIKLCSKASNSRFPGSVCTGYLFVRGYFRYLQEECWPSAWTFFPRHTAKHRSRGLGVSKHMKSNCWTSR